MSDAKDKMFLMLCCPGRFFTSFWLHTVYSAKHVALVRQAAEISFPDMSVGIFLAIWSNTTITLFKSSEIGLCLHDKMMTII